MFFMCTSVIVEQFKMAIFHCVVAFLCWSATYAPTSYKQKDE